MLADQAKGALRGVAMSEEEAIMSWLSYGEIMNEARGLMPSDEQFGKWVEENGLSQLATHEVLRDERSAAMWAAANREDFEATRAVCKARTVRGIHAKWKEIEAERERAEQEAQRKAEAEAKVKEQEPARKSSDISGADKAETSVADGAAGGSAPDITSEPEDEPYDPVHAEMLDATPMSAPDPYGYADLTDEALLETANGLREEAEDLRKRVKAKTAQIADLKARIKDLEADERNEVVRRLSSQVEHQRREMFKAKEEARRALAAKHRAEKRVAELEGAGVAL
jgi:hypothetical protein